MYCVIGVVKIIKLQIIYCLKQNLKSVINALCEIKSAEMRKREGTEKAAREKRRQREGTEKKD